MRISDWSSDVCSSDLQQIDARLVVHAGIEEQVAGHQRRRLLPLHVESDAAIAAPVIGNGAAAVRYDEPELGKPLEEVGAQQLRSEEHTSELQSLMRISYAVFCLKKKKGKKADKVDNHGDMNDRVNITF